MTRTEIVDRLRAANIENPEQEAVILISEICAVSRERIIGDRNADYPDSTLLAAVARRENHEPLQYIIGKWYFCDETYCVSPSCLIPRADTEMLVLYAAQALPVGACFADLCTGSGCICISTLAKRQDLTAVAVDISRDALDIAEKNSVLNGVDSRIRFFEHDILTSCENGKSDTFYKNEMFDAIISNPPYIKSGDLVSLAPELSYEPVIALDGGPDGLLFYRKILSDFNKHLKPGGFFLFETGYDTADDIKTLAVKSGFSCEIMNDHSGNPRMAVIRQRY